MKTTLKLALLGSALALGAGPAGAVDYYLAAKAFTKTLPDGSVVPMWGYVEDAGGNCYNAADDAARLACVAGLPDPTIPGPRLRVENGAGNPVDALRIFLSNGLSEPTSVVITGQELPFSRNNNGPTFVRPNGTTRIGSRNNANLRVRSFGREAGANGGSERYIWTPFQGTAFVKPGTFIYHSGTHPQKQVYMGLYGAVTREAAAGEAYSGVAYDNEVVLFYSDIDPDQTAAVAGGTHTTSIDYHARWFLVNGEPYSTACTDANTDGFDDASGYPCANMVQTPDIDAGPAGTNTLVRLLSTASETHVPTLQGLHMSIHAEDGNPYTWQDGATVMDTAPREQYSAMLPPLKTKDAIVSAATDGRYAVYDGNGYMTNPSDPSDTDVGDTVGGMLRFLAFGAGADADGDGVVDTLDNCPATANADQTDTDGDGIGDVCDPLTDSDGDGVADGADNCPSTPNADQADADGDGIGDVCDPVMGVDTDGDGVADGADNCPVTPNADQADADGDGIGDVCDPLTDSDGDGVADAADNCPMTANADQTDTDGDGIGDACDATPGNMPPVAVDDTFFVTSMDTVSFAGLADDDGVLVNDTDPDGDPLTATLDTGTAGLGGLNADGSFDYTPSGNGVGELATFTYVANDGTADSNEATVTLRRELSVLSAVCEVQGNGRCDWTIAGNKSNQGNVRVQARCADTGQFIGRVRTGGPSWTIAANNSRAVPDAGTCVTINAQVEGGENTNAQILAFPVEVQ